MRFSKLELRLSALLLGALFSILVLMGCGKSKDEATTSQDAPGTKTGKVDRSK